jgi:hypothetical protein
MNVKKTGSSHGRNPQYPDAHHGPMCRGGSDLPSLDTDLPIERILLSPKPASHVGDLAHKWTDLHRTF